MTHKIKYATGIDVVNCHKAMFEFRTYSPEYSVDYVGVSEDLTREQVRALAKEKFPNATQARRIQQDVEDGSVHGLEPHWTI